ARIPPPSSCALTRLEDTSPVNGGGNQLVTPSFDDSRLTAAALRFPPPRAGEVDAEALSRKADGGGSDRGKNGAAGCGFRFVPQHHAGGDARGLDLALPRL